MGKTEAAEPATDTFLGGSKFRGVTSKRLRLHGPAQKEGWQAERNEILTLGGREMFFNLKGSNDGSCNAKAGGRLLPHRQK